MLDICVLENIAPKQVVRHSDNGSPMKGAAMLATLQKLGVIPSFSRPACSIDHSRRDEAAVGRKLADDAPPVVKVGFSFNGIDGLYESYSHLVRCSPGGKRWHSVMMLGVGIWLTMARQEPQFFTVTETHPKIDESLGLGVGNDKWPPAVGDDCGIGFEEDPGVKRCAAKERKTMIDFKAENVVPMALEGP